MRLGASRALTIVLLVASAFPPPRVANFLIAETFQHDSAEARKTIHARGRNRIGSPFRLDSHRALACLPSGDRATPRPIQHFSRLQVASNTLRRPISRFIPIRASLHLRC